MDSPQFSMMAGPPTPSKFTFAQTGHVIFSIRDFSQKSFVIHFNSVEKELSIALLQKAQELVSQLAELLDLGKLTVSVTDGKLELTWLSKKCEETNADGLGACNES